MIFITLRREDLLFENHHYDDAGPLYVSGEGRTRRGREIEGREKEIAGEREASNKLEVNSFDGNEWVSDSQIEC